MTDTSIKASVPLASPTPEISHRERQYALLFLMFTYAVNFLDRQVLIILQEPIKADLGLSDGQLGLLSGLSFALFYVLAGIPIAYMADRTVRRNVIASALAVWSAMTAVCGAAQNFVQLALARMGVAVGEAGCVPPAHSMISDYYPAEERGKAFSIYSVGVHIGVLAGFLLGSHIAEMYSWRVAFVAVGLPGVLLAIIMRMTVKEPVRGQWDNRETQMKAPSFKESLSLLKGETSYWYISLGLAIASFCAYGLGAFTPSYLMRSHQLNLSTTGTILAFVYGISGIVSAYFSGPLADRLSKTDKSWYLKLPMFASILCLPFALIGYGSSNLYIAIAGVFMFQLIQGFCLVPSITSIQGLVPPHIRALSSAVMLLILNTIGLGLGPTFVGFLSDFYATSMDQESLRTALQHTAFASIGATACYFVAIRKLPGNFLR